MEEVKAALISETERRILEESIPRIVQCLGYLSEEEVWHEPNKNSNSIGVMVLHLIGNVRQWLLGAACQVAYERNRDKEFSPVTKPAKMELIKHLNQLDEDVRKHLPKMEATSLLEKRNVQCYNETVISIIIHVIEHFSYHTGQIVYYTKLLKDVDTAFYAGQDLTANG
jgi:uncharacterized damage-inducible protein DinB